MSTQTNESRSTVYKSDVAAFNDPRRYFIDWISDGMKVLDVGCACGDFVKSLSCEKTIEAYGMEYDRGSIEKARNTGAFREIFQIDLNSFDQAPFERFFGFFDVVSFGDVLEHLMNPLGVLLDFRRFLKPDGYFLISLPNIAHASVKAALLQDRFEYMDAGIMDKTHIRFFTYRSIGELLAAAKIKIVDARGTFTNQKKAHWVGDDGLPEAVQQFIANDPHSFVMQYVMKAKVCDLPGISSENIEKLRAIIKDDRGNYYDTHSIPFFVKFSSCFIPVKSWRRKYRDMLCMRLSKGRAK